MSFEKYLQFYSDGNGKTMRAGGLETEFEFSVDLDDSHDYRLFTVGETEQFYMWKDEPDGQYI